MRHRTHQVCHGRAADRVEGDPSPRAAGQALHLLHKILLLRHDDGLRPRVQKCLRFVAVRVGAAGTALTRFAS